MKLALVIGFLITCSVSAGPSDSSLPKHLDIVGVHQPILSESKFVEKYINYDATIPYYVPFPIVNPVEYPVDLTSYNLVPHESPVEYNLYSNRYTDVPVPYEHYTFLDTPYDVPVTLNAEEYFFIPKDYPAKRVHFREHPVRVPYHDIHPLPREVHVPVHSIHQSVVNVPTPFKYHVHFPESRPIEFPVDFPNPRVVEFPVDYPEYIVHSESVEYPITSNKYVHSDIPYAFPVPVPTEVEIPTPYKYPIPFYEPVDIEAPVYVPVYVPVEVPIPVYIPEQRVTEVPYSEPYGEDIDFYYDLPVPVEHPYPVNVDIESFYEEPSPIPYQVPVREVIDVSVPVSIPVEDYQHLTVEHPVPEPVTVVYDYPFAVLKDIPVLNKIPNFHIDEIEVPIPFSYTVPEIVEIPDYHELKSEHIEFVEEPVAVKNDKQTLFLEEPYEKEHIIQHDVPSQLPIEEHFGYPLQIFETSIQGAFASFSRSFTGALSGMSRHQFMQQLNRLERLIIVEIHQVEKGTLVFGSYNTKVHNEFGLFGKFLASLCSKAGTCPQYNLQLLWTQIQTALASVVLELPSHPPAPIPAPIPAPSPSENYIHSIQSTFFSFSQDFINGLSEAFKLQFHKQFDHLENILLVGIREVDKGHMTFKKYVDQVSHAFQDFGRFLASFCSNKTCPKYDIQLLWTQIRVALEKYKQI